MVPPWSEKEEGVVVLSVSFFLSVNCAFLGVTELQDETRQGDLFLFVVVFALFSSRLEESETQRGDWGTGGQVNLPFFCCLVKESFTLSSKKKKKHPTHQEMYFYMMKKALY